MRKKEVDLTDFYEFSGEFYCTQEVLARCLRITQQRVSQLTEENLFVRKETPKGCLYDLNENIRYWVYFKAYHQNPFKDI